MVEEVRGLGCARKDEGGIEPRRGRSSDVGLQAIANNEGVFRSRPIQRGVEEMPVRFAGHDRRRPRRLFDRCKKRTSAGPELSSRGRVGGIGIGGHEPSTALNEHGSHPQGVIARLSIPTNHHGIGSIGLTFKQDHPALPQSGSDAFLAERVHRSFGADEVRDEWDSRLRRRYDLIGRCRHPQRVKSFSYRLRSARRVIRDEDDPSAAPSEVPNSVTCTFDGDISPIEHSVQIEKERFISVGKGVSSGCPCGCLSGYRCLSGRPLLARVSGARRKPGGHPVSRERAARYSSRGDIATANFRCAIALLRCPVRAQVRPNA